MQKIVQKIVPILVYKTYFFLFSLQGIYLLDTSYSVTVWIFNNLTYFSTCPGDKGLRENPHTNYTIPTGERSY